VVLAWFGPAPIWNDIKGLPKRVRWGLVLNGGLAALNSALIYTGLEYTSSTNAILLGRLAPVLYALSGAMAFGRFISRREWLGFGFYYCRHSDCRLDWSQLDNQLGATP